MNLHDYLNTTKAALLALEDGTVYQGEAFGATATTVGEAVFNTSMSGYQEVLTDPSYHGQIVAMTAPQIGNYGTSPQDHESGAVQVRGFVVRDLSPVASNWRSRQTLPDFLTASGIPCISGIDTRALTKHLRMAGAMKACLSTEGLPPEEAVERAHAWEGLVGHDYVTRVTSREPWAFRPDPGELKRFTVEGTHLGAEPPERKRYRVAVLDFGTKRNILRKLHAHGFDVMVFPAHARSGEVREYAPDALFLTNGPGDPDPLDYAHRTVASLIEHYPTCGICMGNQIVTHALQAKTFKLKFGHRGGNQPVKNVETGTVRITSQNHGFAAKKEDLEARGAVVTEINLNDETVEGLRHRDLPLFTVQYHPEAAPGPHDADPVFEEFYQLVARVKG